MLHDISKLTIVKQINTGYLLAHIPWHPNAWEVGYVYLHRLVMENKVGRYLIKGEIVHHKDDNKLNNSSDNLEIIGPPG